MSPEVFFFATTAEEERDLLPEGLSTPSIAIVAEADNSEPLLVSLFLGVFSFFSFFSFLGEDLLSLASVSPFLDENENLLTLEIVGAEADFPLAAGVSKN